MPVKNIFVTLEKHMYYRRRVKAREVGGMCGKNGAEGVAFKADGPAVW